MHEGKIAVLTARGYKAASERHHEPPVLLYFSGFPGWLAWFSLQMFCLNNKIHFSLANANNSASFKRKMVLNHRFCSFTTTNKLVNEAANDSARVSGQDRKIPPALGTNQIAGFGWFHPLASLEKNNFSILLSTVESFWPREKPQMTGQIRQAHSKASAWLSFKNLSQCCTLHPGIVIVLRGT